jgi:hypothetical protein
MISRELEPLAIFRALVKIEMGAVPSMGRH